MKILSLRHIQGISAYQMLELYFSTEDLDRDLPQHVKENGITIFDSKFEVIEMGACRDRGPEGQTYQFQVKSL